MHRLKSEAQELVIAFPHMSKEGFVLRVEVQNNTQAHLRQIGDAGQNREVRRGKDIETLDDNQINMREGRRHQGFRLKWRL